MRSTDENICQTTLLFEQMLFEPKNGEKILKRFWKQAKLTPKYGEANGLKWEDEGSSKLFSKLELMKVETKTSLIDATFQVKKIGRCNILVFWLRNVRMLVKPKHSYNFELHFLRKYFGAVYKWHSQNSFPFWCRYQKRFCWAWWSKGPNVKKWQSFSNVSRSMK